MNDQLKPYVEKFDALSIRERALIVVTVLVLVGYLWWYLFAQKSLSETRLVEQQNIALESEIQVMDITYQQISQRIQQGVHKPQEQQLVLLQAELDRLNSQLQQKTLELINPDDMFNLMQQLIFSESKLKLTGLKRKRVTPVFESNPGEDEQAEIYRHVMQMGFKGSYRDILNYIRKLEDLEWKLIWDHISLKLDEYPLIDVEIEISTLSDSQHWVGL